MTEGLLALGLFLLVFIFSKMNTLETKVKRLEYMMERLEKYHDLPEPEVNKDIKKLLEEEKDVKAVKLARENLGLSLIEAKKYVDDLNLQK